MYPDSDHCLNLMGSKLDQDLSYDFFLEDPTCSVCGVLLMKKGTNRQTEKQTNDHENNTSLVKVEICH